MDKIDRFLAPTEQPNPLRRGRWKRSLVELNGKFEPKYRHDISGLLMQSYSEVGLFSHSYHIAGAQCPTHMSWFANVAYMDAPAPFRKQGVAALQFDTKGIYLASVTKEGCLTVHDFETLYSQVNFGCSSGLMEDEKKHLLHISTCQQLDVVRWNIANQDEVACTSMKSSEVHIYDIGYISSDPIEVLRKRPTINIHGIDVHKGLSDIAFSSKDDSRVLASDTNGIINVWDRRMSDLPCLEITTTSNSTLNSIQLAEEDQIIFGACKNGIIHMWDLRGGRSSTAFQSHKQAYYSPFTSVKVASLLEKVWPLKAQSNIISKEIHSIDLDPSCPYQLAFHLDDGWSGVLNIHNFQVTHVHCPPPPWLDGENVFTNLSCLRKPSWLPTYSIYTVGSAYENGIHLLDFYPDPSSPCHVDYDEATKHGPWERGQHKQNRFVQLSEGVTVCAAHPVDGTIVAGTKQSSLCVISQKHESVEADKL
ncbi:uncharacterized protein LOC127790420 [Diospyros lotus]|uniref:uncharacterized protein LOC127790420 n=1 Tax=Diospyros lotus TaxID=55363 RepID=UPI002259F33C|nr:uncharacterized protein LOC127790420 [Diospyros lotus]XP_052175907.1 uncharacterized protein LOC127790420 [Diospyros lotus]